jgi:hypothetical protein
MLGGAKLGVYRDECDGIHPDTITKYYGTHGRSQRLEGETGAGHPPDERASDIADKIHVQQDRNIKHDAVDVPNHANPFSSQPESEAIFRSVLKEVIEQEVVPAGYGIRPNEWDNDAYPDTEDLIVGGKRQAITLSLRDPIWKARATRWVQGLAVLTQFNL